MNVAIFPVVSPSCIHPFSCAQVSETPTNQQKKRKIANPTLQRRLRQATLRTNALQRRLRDPLRTSSHGWKRSGVMQRYWIVLESVGPRCSCGLQNVALGHCKFIALGHCKFMVMVMVVVASVCFVFCCAEFESWRAKRVPCYLADLAVCDYK